MRALILIIAALSICDLPIAHGHPVESLQKIQQENLAKPDLIMHKESVSANDTTSKDSYLATTGDVPAECSKGMYQIHNANDLAAISNCEVIDGTILITDYLDIVVDLGNIGSILGDLIISRVGTLQKIQGDGLQVITGQMKFEELTSLTNIKFPSLTSVNALNWTVLPILNSFSFDSGMKNVESVIIVDTALAEFTGFDVETLKILDIRNNRFLETINSKMEKVTEELTVASNADSINVNFSSLTWVNNLTFRGVRSLELSSLEEVDATIGFIDNGFNKLQLPKLRSVGGTLIINENKLLKEVELSLLQEVEGGLIVENNPQISKMSFFPKLQAIGGAIKFKGDFKDLSFPKLRLVKGSASLKTASNAFNCANWIKTEASVFVRGGKIECSADSKSSETIHVDSNGLITGSLDANGKSLNTRSSGGSILQSSRTLITTTLIILLLSIS